jgi:hypothetical protein
VNKLGVDRDIRSQGVGHGAGSRKKGPSAVTGAVIPPGPAAGSFARVAGRPLGRTLLSPDDAAGAPLLHVTPVPSPARGRGAAPAAGPVVMKPSGRSQPAHAPGLTPLARLTAASASPTMPAAAARGGKQQGLGGKSVTAIPAAAGVHNYGSMSSSPALPHQDALQASRGLGTLHVPVAKARGARDDDSDETELDWVMSDSSTFGLGLDDSGSDSGTAEYAGRRGRSRGRSE